MNGKNNPFNIRFSRNNLWIGQIGQTDGFVDFSDIEYCIRAAALLIMRSYRSKNVLTISDIINRYAPKTENNTFAYIDFVCSNLGLFPFDIPSDFNQYVDLLHWMSVMEVGRDYAVSVLEIKAVCYKYKIKPIKTRKK